MDFLFDNAEKGPILVVGPGGAGKTTLLRQLCLQCALRQIASDRIPVLLNLTEVESRTLSEFIALALAHWGAYINPAALELQFRDGRFLFLIDGLSEITDIQLRAFCLGVSAIRPQSIDRPNLIILAARHDDDVALTLAPGLPATQPQVVRLTELDVADLAGFCRAGLASIRETSEVEVPDHEVQVVAKQLERLPRTALIIRLAIQEYQRSGRIGPTPLALFEQTFSQLIRPIGAALGGPALLYLLGHIAWQKFVGSRGERTITESAFAALTARIQEETQIWTKYQGAFTPGMVVLRDLLRSGLLIRTGPRVRFWHDSFEDYLIGYHFYHELWATPGSRKLEVLAANRAFSEALGFVAEFARRDKDTELLSVVEQYQTAGPTAST
jgi:hypothetical protein